MKKSIIFLVLIAATFAVAAEEIINLHKKDLTVISHETSAIDHMQFSADETALYITQSGIRTSVQVPELDSITFSDVPVKSIRKIYKNPVSDYSLPDPTVLRAEDGYFYLYATEDIRHMPIFRSKDLLDWRHIGTVFTQNTRPAFVENGGLWAPDINYIDGKYIMYYSMSTWGGEWECGIGVAVADRPQGPFTDLGKLFISSEIGVQNSIDAFFMEENGRRYLIWGSFRGIYAVELSEDALSIKSGAKPMRMAGGAFEATYIYKRDGYYYLFASIGSCCAGVNSTYQVVVGRSRSLFGSYTNRQGVRMLDNGYELVISKNSRFVGNGHNARIMQDDAGNDWMLYHGVDLTNEKGRKLMLDQIHWTEDGWPYVEGGTPSEEAYGPVFYN